MIHSSVSATGWRDGLARDRAADSPLYWDCKEEVERLMRAARFETFVLLKPAFMMENFIAPKAAQMFPDLSQRRILVALPLDCRLALVAARDIGGAAVAATERPDDFRGQSVELAGDILSIQEIGRTIGAVTGTLVSVDRRSRDELVDRGQSSGWIDSQMWIGGVGYPARPEHQRAFGLVPTSFAAWAASNEAPLREVVGGYPAQAFV